MKGGSFGIYQHPLCCKIPKKIEGGPFGEKIFRSLAMPKKTERGDPLVSSGIVGYAGNLFGSVPWANRGNLNFVELLVELFWSLQVCRKKTLTKSHDYSRLFSLEKRRLKKH